MKKKLERHIERPVVKYARERGLVALKMKLDTQAGWPDQIIVGPHGRVLWMEFKKPGGKVTPLQAHRHGELRDLGHTVLVVDDVEHGQTAINTLLEGGHGTVFVTQQALPTMTFDEAAMMHLGLLPKKKATKQ